MPSGPSPLPASLLTQPKVVAWVALAFLLTFTIELQRWLWPFITDDAFITFRYVERFLSGQGLTFNAEERVEGFSNPLWLFLLAAAKGVWGGDVPTWARGLGAFFQLSALAALGLLCARLPKPLSLPTFFLSLCFLLLTPGVQVYATLGLEVPLLMFLLLAGVAASVWAYPARPVWLLGAGVCFGLAGLARPEGVLYGALWGAGVLALWRGRFKACWVGAGGLALAPAVAYQFFRLSYFKAWLPNTAVAKVRGFFGDSPFLTEWTPWLPTVFMLGALVLLLSHAPRQPGERRALAPLLTLAAGPVLAGLVFWVYAGTDWMLLGRFILPVWPLVVVCLCALLEEGLWAHGVSPWRAAGVRACILLASAMGWLYVSLPFLANQNLGAMLMRGTDQAVVGQWLAHHFPQPLTVATNRLGAVSYYAPQHTFRDVLGLTDRAQARLLRADPVKAFERVGLSEANPLMTPRPDILLVTRPPQTGLASAYADAEKAFLDPTYTLVQRFAQGNWGTFDVWVRHGLMPAP